jgi:hypothetical protein
MFWRFGTYGRKVSRADAVDPNQDSSQLCASLFQLEDPLGDLAQLRRYLRDILLHHFQRHSHLRWPRFTHRCLLGTLMSMQPMAATWFYDNWSSGKRNPTSKWRFLVGWNVSIVVVGTFLMVAGTYGSIADIEHSFKSRHGAVSSSADNSGSV